MVLRGEEDQRAGAPFADSARAVLLAENSYPAELAQKAARRRADQRFVQIDECIKEQLLNY